MLRKTRFTWAVVLLALVLVLAAGAGCGGDSKSSSGGSGGSGSSDMSADSRAKTSRWASFCAASTMLASSSPPMIRTTVLIWLIIPMAIIAITVGLLLTRMPFGFMAMLGVLALGGELIKNQIVVLSKILTLIGKGTPPYQAILDGGERQVSQLKKSWSKKTGWRPL